MKAKLNKVLSTTVALSMVVTPGAVWAAEDGTKAPGTSAAVEQTAAPAFKDIGKAASWAREQIVQAKEMKWLGGYPDGTFRPLDNLTRREAAIIISGALKLELPNKGESSYSDVKKWGIKEVEAVKEAGIMVGREKGKFNPDEKITRQELAIILVKAAKMDVKDKGDNLSVKDKERIWPVAKPYVQAAIESGLMVGYNNYFSPRDTATRQEMAVMAVNLAAQIKKSGSYHTYAFDIKGLDTNVKAGELLKAAPEKNTNPADVFPGVTPVKIGLAVSQQNGKAYDGKVRIEAPKAEGVQLWAKDSEGNWKDINQTGWGAAEGFTLGTQPVTDVYVIAVPGQRSLTLTAVDVDQKYGAPDHIVAKHTGTINTSDLNGNVALQYIAPQDFSVRNDASVKGYTVGFETKALPVSEIAKAEISLYKDDKLLATNTSTDKLFSEYPDYKQFSSPFDVKGAFKDNYWTYDGWKGSETDVPNKAVIKVTDKKGNTYTVENTKLTGDTKPIVPQDYTGEAAAEYVAAQDFSIVKTDAVDGYNVGFELKKFPASEVAKAEVSLYNGDKLLVTNTSKDRMFSEKGSEKQLSTRFDLAGKLTDNHWTYGQWTGEKTVVPTKAVIKITDKKGNTYTIENTKLNNDTTPTAPAQPETGGQAAGQ
ncbi:S-layer homology domain-containing protein [Aneurinibacillus sp. REN35]|uniref:S-layer homology domain-containing protein n=1 Tax=Aneurinibacillus sp. REN35 TaxID=3237286 RepID=UPI00352869FF